MYLFTNICIESFNTCAEYIYCVTSPQCVPGLHAIREIHEVFQSLDLHSQMSLKSYQVAVEELTNRIIRLVVPVASRPISTAVIWLLCRTPRLLSCPNHL